MDPNPLEELKLVSDALSLEFEEQDWGIINSDPKRIEEFIEFFNCSSLEDKILFHVFELIAASVNERLLDEPDVVGLEKSILFIINNAHRFPSLFSYWYNLDSIEFPLGAVLRTQR